MIRPALCRLVTKPFNDPAWVWQRKYDGARIIAECQAEGVVRLQARSGADKTANFPELLVSTREHCVLDGELIEANGASFQDGIQTRINRLEDVTSMSRLHPASYIIFDVIEKEGKNLRHYTLAERMRLLQSLEPDGTCQIIKSYLDGEWLYKFAKSQNWEGIVGKRLDEPYLEGKRKWLKIKAWQEGIFTVIGYTPGEGKRKDLPGALVLECGTQVGTGFADAELADLSRWMKDIACNNKYTDVEPFKIRVKYLEVTNDGQLRFPVYKGRA